MAWRGPRDRLEGAVRKLAGPWTMPFAGCRSVRASVCLQYRKIFDLFINLETRTICFVAGIKAVWHTPSCANEH